VAEDEISRRAYEEGRIAQRIEMRLGDHDQQFIAMRASVQSLTDQLKVVAAGQETMDEKIDDLSLGEKVRQQTNEGIRKALQEANDRQISSRGFFFATAGVVLTLIGLIISVLIAVHAF
jgi:hypothetical protein